MKSTSRFEFAVTTSRDALLLNACLAFGFTCRGVHNTGFYTEDTSRRGWVVGQQGYGVGVIRILLTCAPLKILQTIILRLAIYMHDHQFWRRLRQIGIQDELVNWSGLRFPIFTQDY